MKLTFVYLLGLSYAVMFPGSEGHPCVGGFGQTLPVGRILPSTDARCSLLLVAGTQALGDGPYTSTSGGNRTQSLKFVGRTC